MRGFGCILKRAAATGRIPGGARSHRSSTAENKKSSESRWSYLYRAEPAIRLKPSPCSRLCHCANQTGRFSRFVTEQIGALEHLKNASTAQLERVFAEHIDSVSYRLDAWIEGMLKFHLSAMRFQPGEEGVEAKQGLYLGAYGWLEEVKPEFKELKTKSLRGELSEIFNKKRTTLVTDNTNCGYIHAPSLNHAVTAAVLRNAHLAYESEQNGQSFAINLTFESRRHADVVFGGHPQRAKPAAFLGYELSGPARPLHRIAQLFLDGFISSNCATAYPPVHRMSTTTTSAGDEPAGSWAKLIEPGKNLGILFILSSLAGRNQQQAEPHQCHVGE